MEKIKIEGKEIKYAVAGVALILGWFLFIKPAIAPFLKSIHPTLATIIFNVGLLGGLWLLSSLLNGHSFHIKFSIIAFTILMGVNILTAPYLVDTSGQIHTEIDYWYVSTDAGFVSIWQPFVPQSWLWTFAYIVDPIILMIIVPVIITNPHRIKKAFDDI